MKYIYLLIDPITNEIRYVGQTIDLKSRFFKHCRDKGKYHKAIWIQRLKRLGYKPIMKVIQSFENISDEDLNNAEIYWIKQIKDLGNDLTNSTEGGQGNIGHKHSLETRLMMSKNRQGRKAWNKGIKATLDARLNMSKAHSGVKLSEDHKLKILKGKKLSRVCQVVRSNESKT